MAYFLKEKVIIDWQFLFVVGVLFGALASAWLSKEKRAVAVPPMWEGRFGASRVRRWTAAFLGGIVLMFGDQRDRSAPSDLRPGSRTCGLRCNTLSKKRDLTYYEHMLIMPIQGEADVKTEVLQTDRRHARENLFPTGGSGIFVLRGGAFNPR